MNKKKLKALLKAPATKPVMVALTAALVGWAGWNVPAPILQACVDTLLNILSVL